VRVIDLSAVWSIARKLMPFAVGLLLGWLL
jgi:hypothetical protein